MSSVLETAPANVTTFTGFIQSTGGKFVACDPESGALHLADEASTVFATSKSGVLQLANVSADLYFEFDASAQQVALRALGDSLPGAFSIAVHRHRDGQVVLAASDGIRCLEPRGNGRGLTLLPNARQAGNSAFMLIEHHVHRHVSSSERACCAPPHPQSNIRPMWNDPGHHSLVEDAMTFLTSRCGVAEERLRSLWKDDTFKASVFKGLRDADYVNPYNDGGVFEGAWRSHFYDPDTKTNYRGEHNRTALTEGLKYYQEAMGASDLKSAGFNLGLALHYYSDLTQPMHAANFAEFYGRHYPLPTFTQAHTFFEEVGDEVIKRTPPTLHENFAYASELSAEALFIETARRAKAIFNRMTVAVSPLDLRCSMLIPAEGLLDRLRLRPIMAVFAKDALQAGIEQVARFLYTWATEFHAIAYNPAGTRWRVREMRDDGTVAASSDELWEFGPVLLRAGESFGGYRPLPNSDRGYVVEQWKRGTCEVYFVSPTRFISVKDGQIWRFGELAGA